MAKASRPSAVRFRYFDASALVKRYVREPASETVHRLLGLGVASTSRLSEVEVASALARLVREEALPAAERDRAVAALVRDVSAMHVIELTPTVTALARSLLERHPLRSSDAIQLASCLYLREQMGDDVVFVAFDDRLVAAARREGVRDTGEARA